MRVRQSPSGVFLEAAPATGVGTLAARPLAAERGALYFATDVRLGTLFVWDGSAWDETAMSSDLIAWGSTSVLAATSFLTFGGAAVAAGTETNVGALPLPMGGVIRRMRARHMIGVASDVTYTLRRNQADTALVCTVPATQLVADDLVDTVPVSPGELLGVRAVTPSGVTLTTRGMVSFEFLVAAS
jgi:hypothetical protein